MHATLSIGSLFLALSAFSAGVRAFHVESGTPCTTVGSACSYVSNDSSGGGSADTTVHGYCAPDLHCASNGATCANDDECYNYCGSGVCGGQGAGCNSQDTFALGQPGISCSGDYTCSEEGAVGQCLPSSEVKLVATNAAAPSQRARRHRRRSTQVQQRQVRAADLRARS